MPLTQNLGRLLHTVAVAAVTAAVASLVHVWPELSALLPPKVSAIVAVLASLAQAGVGQKAFDVNWNGSPAEFPAPPKKEVR